MFILSRFLLSGFICSGGNRSWFQSPISIKKIRFISGRKSFDKLVPKHFNKLVESSVSYVLCSLGTIYETTSCVFTLFSFKVDTKAATHPSLEDVFKFQTNLFQYPVPINNILLRFRKVLWGVYVECIPVYKLYSNGDKSVHEKNEVELYSCVEKCQI